MNNAESFQNVMFYVANRSIEDAIKGAFKDDLRMLDHFMEKWVNRPEHYGTTTAAFHLWFYFQLGGDYRARMINWINENYSNKEYER